MIRAGHYIPHLYVLNKYWGGQVWHMGGLSFGERYELGWRELAVESRAVFCYAHGTCSMLCEAGTSGGAHLLMQPRWCKLVKVVVMGGLSSWPTDIPARRHSQGASHMQCHTKTMLQGVGSVAGLTCKHVRCYASAIGDGEGTEHALPACTLDLCYSAP